MLTLNPVTSAVYQQNTSNQPDEAAPARYYLPRLGSYHELNMPLQLEQVDLLSALRNIF